MLINHNQQQDGAHTSDVRSPVDPAGQRWTTPPPTSKKSLKPRVASMTQEASESLWRSSLCKRLLSSDEIGSHSITTKRGHRDVVDPRDIAHTDGMGNRGNP